MLNTHKKIRYTQAECIEHVLITMERRKSMRKIFTIGVPIAIAVFLFTAFHVRNTEVRAVANDNTNMVVVNVNTANSNSEVRALDTTVDAGDDANVTDEEDIVVTEEDDTNVNADDLDATAEEDAIALDAESANGDPDSFTISKTTAYIAGGADLLVILILLILALRRRGPKA